MGLGFTKPDPGVTDGLLLDAAWERAKQCETELLQARAIAKSNHEQFMKMADRRLKLYHGIEKIISKHEGQDEPGTPLRSVLADLYRLLSED